ncbi:hypothetical protein BV25DRAFT_1898289 [Artomyces pyxidatus]|uniref:Uncharacterized protein n=1 Tax=Artomyces pyxidatus TaxID=48021 RepID=A0ACB8TA41_9AGAM|nr:hypothetical protein BV25DRAFT_1898289 [Artomyces pyxidatus]
MPATTQPEIDVLFGQLQRRLVESGEWDRICLLLQYKLNDQGWLDTLRGQSRENARTMDILSIRALLTSISDVQVTPAPVPDAVRTEVTNIIRQALEKQLDRQRQAQPRNPPHPTPIRHQTHADVTKTTGVRHFSRFTAICILPAPRNAHLLHVHYGLPGTQEALTQADRSRSPRGVAISTLPQISMYPLLTVAKRGPAVDLQLRDIFKTVHGRKVSQGVTLECTVHYDPTMSTRDVDKRQSTPGQWCRRGNRHIEGQMLGARKYSSAAKQLLDLDERSVEVNALGHARSRMARFQIRKSSDLGVKLEVSSRQKNKQNRSADGCMITSQDDGRTGNTRAHMRAAPTSALPPTVLVRTLRSPFDDIANPRALPRMIRYVGMSDENGTIRWGRERQMREETLLARGAGTRTALAELPLGRATRGRPYGRFDIRRQRMIRTRPCPHQDCLCLKGRGLTCHATHLTGMKISSSPRLPICDRKYPRGGALEILEIESQSAHTASSAWLDVKKSRGRHPPGRAAEVHSDRCPHSKHSGVIPKLANPGKRSSCASFQPMTIPRRVLPISVARTGLFTGQVTSVLEPVDGSLASWYVGELNTRGGDADGVITDPRQSVARCCLGVEVDVLGSMKLALCIGRRQYSTAKPGFDAVGHRPELLQATADLDVKGPVRRHWQLNGMRCRWSVAIPRAARCRNAVFQPALALLAGFKILWFPGFSAGERKTLQDIAIKAESGRVRGQQSPPSSSIGILQTDRSRRRFNRQRQSPRTVLPANECLIVHPGVLMNKLVVLHELPATSMLHGDIESNRP